MAINAPTHHAILSPTWVWIWYFDENKGKHIKELYDSEAEEWIKSNAK